MLRRTRRPTVLAASGDLRLRGLVRRFGAATAVDGLSLTVESGGLLALVGPSGCGKSTTLRLVAGLDQPSDGRILIGDTDITDAPAHVRPVNTVFQGYALFPHLSVVDNVAFGPRRRGVPVGEARRLAAEMLDVVRLGHLADRRPTRLSGGEQQRVALARALVNRPAVLLLDEPLAALDLELRRRMRDELRRLHADLGTTFVHVTHDQEEALALATTVAVMNAGRIEQAGPPEEVHDLPRSAFVATFLGRSNLVPGTVAGIDGDLVVVDLAGRGRVRVPASRTTGRCCPGTRLLVGVRPEKVRLVPTDREAGATPSWDPGTNVVPRGRVVQAAFVGSATELRVDVAGVGEYAVLEQNLGVRASARPGDEVDLGWDLRHTFALASGAADPAPAAAVGTVVDGAGPGRDAGTAR